MVHPDRGLSPQRAARVYDRIGRWQDTQGFYERRAVAELLRAGRFGTAGSVVEVGCGTGRLAARLLSDHLPAGARYAGLDVSPRMVDMSRRRLRAWSGRAEVARVDGHSPWPVTDASADRVLAVYVLDLMTPSTLEVFFSEAARVLRPGGLVASASLAPGAGGVSRLVSAGWTALWRVDSRLTGGCRPLDPATLMPQGWQQQTTRSVTSWAITSSVVVAEPPRAQPPP